MIIHDMGILVSYEVFEKFKEFRDEVEKQLGKGIKSLRFDPSDEYSSQEFLAYL